MLFKVGSADARVPAAMHSQKTAQKMVQTMRLFPASAWPRVALMLMLALEVVTTSSALPVSVGPVSVGDDLAMDESPVSDNGQIHELVRILNGAYENALLHDSSKADLESSDVLLETASIQFSSRVLREVKEGSCGSNVQAVAEASACALADPSLALGDWAEMLSYAAYRLENLARSASAPDGSDSSHAVVIERMESMEHLYRMVFAVSKIYLDQAQSRAYLEAAQEQLKLARGHMEAERNLCECDSSAYAGRLLGLTELNDQMNDMRSVALP